MASLRNLAITILRLAGHATIAAALRYHARRPDRPLRNDHELADGLAGFAPSPGRCSGTVTGHNLRRASGVYQDKAPARVIEAESSSAAASTLITALSGGAS